MVNSAKQVSRWSLHPRNIFELFLRAVSVPNFCINTKALKLKLESRKRIFSLVFLGQCEATWGNKEVCCLVSPLENGFSLWYSSDNVRQHGATERFAI